MTNQTADFNPETHIRGDDGQIYERKIVQATGIAVGMHTDQPKTAMALEKAMTKAVQDAHEQGVTDPNHIKDRIAAAHAKALNTTENTGSMDA